MEQNPQNKLIIAAVIALLVGAGGGYFIGVAQGKKSYVAEQAALVEAEKKAAQEAIAASANPFAETVNPFEEGGYKNPFKGAVSNPFQQ